MSFPQAPRGTIGANRGPAPVTSALTLTRSKSSSNAAVDISKQLGRDQHSAPAVPPGGNSEQLSQELAKNKNELVKKMRQLQSNLTSLQQLHSHDASSLNDHTYDVTEQLLFDSREVGREIAKLLKAVTDSASRSGSSDDSTANLQQIFLALQSSIEKGANLLLAKHKLKAGEKRKNQQRAKEEHEAERNLKRVKGGESDPLSQVDNVLAQAKALQILQSKLATQQSPSKPHSAPMSIHASGASTPTRLRSTQPHAVGAPLSTAGADMDARMDDGPPSSARSDDSMISEADSEATMAQRQEMIDNLMKNIEKLRTRIAQEKGNPSSSGMVPDEERKYDEDDYQSDSSMMLDSSGILDESQARDRPFMAPAGVPRLNLISLQSTCSALENLLKQSLRTMAELAAAQDRELRKKQWKKQIVQKRGGPVSAEDLTGPFALTQGASFGGGRTFREAEMERDRAAVARQASAEDGTATEAARSQEAVAAALAKLSDVPRPKTTVFASAARFPEDARNRAPLNKAQERKKLFERYEQLQAETLQMLLDAERRNQPADELTMALNATKPKLVHNISMGVDPALKEKQAPRSVAAAIAQHERERAERREKEVGPGAYMLEHALAMTQRRVTGVPSWGSGPPSAMEGDDDSLAMTERFVSKQTATGVLGPGSHVVSETLVTKRIPGPKMVPTEDGETVQARRARELQEPNELMKAQYEMEVDYDELDATVRKRVPQFGALVLPSPDKSLNPQQEKVSRIHQERLAKIAAEAKETEERIDALAKTKRQAEQALRTHKREDFLKAEEEKMERTARLLALGPEPVELHPNIDYVLPRKPVFRYAAPKTLQDLQDEGTKHGASARKRSAAQLAKQVKREETAEAKDEKVLAFQKKVNALRSSQGLAMNTMLGRPQPKSDDPRDYDAHKSKDFLQSRAPGDNWARASRRDIAEPTLDPEVDDIIGGGEGDVLDLDISRADGLTKPRIKGISFGPERGLQTLSDTELDYANGAGEDDREVLYPNLDFGRKRQGIGGALRFDKMVLGGSRSEPDEDEDEIFPYLAEGNMRLNVSYSQVEPKVRNGRFAVRREEFMKLHKKAKERELAKEQEAAGQLMLNPHLMTGTQRHKPSVNMSFSARHDTGGDADEELDDMEGLGEFFDGVRKTRGGPAAYTPGYAWKDPHLRGATFAKDTGRPHLDDDDDPLLREEDNRDFMGGVMMRASQKKDANKPEVNSALPGANFGKSVGRRNQADEDQEDFPDLNRDGDVLNLNPQQVGSSIIKGGAINMARTTGREEKDELDIEADEVRLDLQNIDGLKKKKILGAHSFAKSVGRGEADRDEVEGPLEGDTNIDPNYDFGRLSAPTTKFSDTVRFGVDSTIEASAPNSDYQPSDSYTRKNPRAAFFGTDLARPEPLGLEDAQSQLFPQKIPSHIPSVDFAHGAPRNQPLPPLEDAKTVLMPEDALLHPSTVSASFARAQRLPQTTAQALSDAQRLALVLPDSDGTGTTFGREQRPGYGVLKDGKQEGSVLHPEVGDEFLRKQSPEWSFNKERRFDSKLDQYVNDEGAQLLLNPDRRAIEPHISEAFFPDADRPPLYNTGNGLSDEQRLALLPDTKLTHPHHPGKTIPKDPRFSYSATNAIPELQEGDKQRELNPNLDAIKPKSPAARVKSRNQVPNELLDPAAAGGNRLDLDPKPMYGKSPSAHITTSLRSSAAGSGSPFSYLDGNRLDLNPNYDTVLPRSPGYSLGEKLFDPHYIPSNQEIRALKDKKTREKMAQELANQRTDYPNEEYLLDLLRSDSPRNLPVARVLGPSGVSAPSPWEDSGAEDESSASFNLPNAGVVASAASLVKAKKMQQAKEVAKEERALRKSLNRLAMSAESSLPLAPPVETQQPHVQVKIMSSKFDPDSDSLRTVEKQFQSAPPAKSLTSTKAAAILPPSSSSSTSSSSQPPRFFIPPPVTSEEDSEIPGESDSGSLDSLFPVRPAVPASSMTRVMSGSRIPAPTPSSAVAPFIPSTKPTLSSSSSSSLSSIEPAVPASSALSSQQPPARRVTFAEEDDVQPAPSKVGGAAREKPRPSAASAAMGKKLSSTAASTVAQPSRSIPAPPKRPVAATTGRAPSIKNPATGVLPQQQPARSASPPRPILKPAKPVIDNDVPSAATHSSIPKLQFPIPDLESEESELSDMLSSQRSQRDLSDYLQQLRLSSSKK